MMPYRLLIDGQLVEGAAALDVIDPATGQVFEHCARADAAQLDAAVAAAKRAFIRRWRSASVRQSASVATAASTRAASAPVSSPSTQAMIAASSTGSAPIAQASTAAINARRPLTSRLVSVPIGTSSTSAASA